MGLYERQVLPRVLNAACGTKMVEPLRRRVCGGLAGMWLRSASARA